MAGITKGDLPHLLAPMLQSPPGLCSKYGNIYSMLSYSKASWGLSVPPHQRGVFTPTRISPSLLSRQSRNGYTFQAGRNLPDKEFCYLRTVIVTAAVHWGLSQKLALTSLTFQHWAGVASYISSCDFA